MKLGQRIKFIAVLNIGSEHSHEIKVALFRSEGISRKRPEEVEAVQVGPEVASDE